MRDLRTTRCWSVLLLLVGFLMAVSSRASLLEAQTIATSIPLPAGVMPAEIRVVGGGFLLIHRGAFRGLTPAGGDSVELLDSNGTPIFRRSPGLDVADATYATLLDATVSVAVQSFATG